MNHLKKILFAVAIAAGVGLIGASNALAVCTVTSGGVTGLTGVPTGVLTVRAEGRNELLSAITVACDGTTSAGSAVVTINLNGANFVLGQGQVANLGGASTTDTTTCVSTGAPDNITKFPCPSLTWTVGGVAAIPVAASVAGNTATFSATVAAGAQTVSIFGLRGDIGGAGLANGSILTATVNLGGAFTLAIAGPSQMANVVTGLKLISNASGFSTVGGPINASVLNILSCAPPIVTPAGTPSTLKASPDPSLGGANSLQVTFSENTLGRFRASPANGGTEDLGFSQAVAAGNTLGSANPGGAGTITPIGTLLSGGTMTGAANGTRLIIQLTGLVAGLSVYAPRTLPGKVNAAQSGSIPGFMVLTRVIGNDVDGSGGAPGAIIQDQFDLVTADNKGNVTIVYEVTTEDVSVKHFITINIALTGTAPTGVGTISGALGLAPGPTPTTNPARPGFTGLGSPSVVAKVFACVTYLLFPFIANTANGNFDTSIAIANTGADTIGTTSAAGSVILNFFKQGGGTNPAPVTLASNLAPGDTATFVLSSIGQAFTGYAIAVCNFPYGHGTAFINNPEPGVGGAFAEIYVAVVMGVDPVTGKRLFPDAGGH